MIFIVGVSLFLMGLFDAIDTLVWAFYAANPGWGDYFAQVKTALYSFNLKLDLALLLIGAAMTIATVLYKRRHRCPGCGQYVRKGQKYCGNCGEKI